MNIEKETEGARDDNNDAGTEQKQRNWLATVPTYIYNGLLFDVYNENYILIISDEIVLDISGTHAKELTY